MNAAISGIADALGVERQHLLIGYRQGDANSSCVVEITITAIAPEGEVSA